jgi:deoxycytidylate deaminase
MDYENTMDYKQSIDAPTELVMGIIGPIGCNRELVIDSIINLAKHFSYSVELIKVSDLILKFKPLKLDPKNQYNRVSRLMDAGNELRDQCKDNSILAKMATIEISERRKKHEDLRVIYIVNSLKHPEEVDLFRDVYGNGFYLFALSSDEKYRNEFLRKHCHIKNEDHREELIDRDKDDELGYGQSTSSAFHMADFFLSEEGDNTKIWNTLERYFDLIFGAPFRTPTFQEYSMFMAQAASFKSADLSRQVGAVITQEGDIISSGANECPKAFGGTYWPEFNEDTNEIKDYPEGRDYMRGMDYNAKEKAQIIESLKKGISEHEIKQLEKNISKSGIKDITEYGRVVHAEMDAILSCSRRGVATKNSIMFCTTHPCHNCAKHIVASGIDKVFYIEPYPKSKALIMHDDSITTDDTLPRNHVKFKAFIGVGPRQYTNLFSMQLSDGKKMKRKESGSYNAIDWTQENSTPRVKSYGHSHIDIEVHIKAEIENIAGLQ